MAAFVDAKRSNLDFTSLVGLAKRLNLENKIPERGNARRRDKDQGKSTARANFVGHDAPNFRLFGLLGVRIHSEELALLCFRRSTLAVSMIR